MWFRRTFFGKPNSWWSKRPSAYPPSFSTNFVRRSMSSGPISTPNREHLVPARFLGKRLVVIRMDELEEMRAKKIAELERYAKDLEVQKTAKPIHLTDDTFPGEVSKPGVLLVDMWGAWCGPCLRIAPTIEKIAQDYGR